MSKIMETNLISLALIPIELLLDILLRLPVKSVARFVCVSKLWQKTIRSDEFIRSYLLRSSSNKLPRLLYALKPNKQEHWCFLTKSAHVLEPHLDLPKPHNPSLPFSLWCTVSSSSSSSLWCTQDHSYAHGLISYVYGGDQIVCNLSTGKYITLPVPLFVTDDTFITSCYLGYDPINGQYKVLCFVFARRLGFYYIQVFTLGDQNCSWRLIQYSTHRPGTRHVCIEGVLYYTAFTNIDTMKEQVLVRFDLRSESLELVCVVTKGLNGLINYHGKVALVKKKMNVFYLRVLEDAKELKWSKKQLTFPSTYNYLEILGTSDQMGEIVFKNTGFKDFVYFLDQTSNQIRSVQLKVSIKHKFPDYKLLTFLHYVESVMFV